MSDPSTVDADAEDTLALIDALVVLRREHGVSLRYHRVWNLIVNGDVPGFRDGRLWRVRTADLPRIAAAFARTAAAA